MPIYRIAELNIKIEPIYKKTRDTIAPFLTDSQNFDFDASAGTDEISAVVEESDTPVSYALTEGSLVLTKICRKVLREYNGFFFHSSSLMLDGEGYLFTALSGTGKSTHTSLWRKRFGDKVTMINDDKPIIRKIDGKFMVCSTPWMGKAGIGNNLIAPLKAVYVLQRGKKNTAETVSPAVVFKQLLEATLFPGNAEDAQKLLTLYDDLFSQVQLILLNCNMDIEAADVAFQAANNKLSEV